MGVVSFSPDKDGVFRREKLFFNYQDNFFPSLSLAPILDQFRDAKIILKKRAIEIRNDGSLIRIPLTKKNEYFVNMYGLYNAFSISGVILSMDKIKAGELDNLPVQPDEFRDKIVFIGASAAGVEDVKNTSIGTNTPGVFLHASIRGNIISGDFLNFTGPAVNFLSILILLTITVFSIFYSKTVLSQVLFPLLAMIIFSVTALLLFTSNIVINIVSPSFAVLSAYVASYTYMSFTEGREKKKIRNILGQYVSPAILSTVLAKNQDGYLKAEVGARETLTIFFSDIRDFTTISEKYNVEEVVEILNTYLSGMVNIIFSNEGTLDKFIGDAIVAFWGAPVKIQDHHYKATITGLKMKEALKTYNQENIGRGWPELRIGIGIHTGEVILGNIGSEKKLDYTVIGDSVNLASRLEGLTKAYKCSIIISQDTYDHVRDEIICRTTDYIKVKGKNKPVKIYEAIGECGSVDEETIKVCHLTEEAFGYYLERGFSHAIDVFESILEIRPEDFLSKMFIDRCRGYKQNEPPEDWDGSYVYREK
jgi:adenylate cyclase